VQSPHNQHWYTVGKAQSWSDASLYAQSRGYELATIRNHSEQDWAYDTFAFLAQSLGGSYYIGLNDFAGIETWASGETSTYRNWNSAGPGQSPWGAYVGLSTSSEPSKWYTDFVGATLRPALFECTASAPPDSNTDPVFFDSDADGLGDGMEQGRDSIQWPGDPANGIAGTDPNVFIPDADSFTTTLPLDPDSDDDGLRDGVEDWTRNGAVDGKELDPNVFDTDGDSLSDGLEAGVSVADIGTDPAVFIPDGDPSTTTHPGKEDTDHGGIPDGVEDSNRNGVQDLGETDPNDSSDDGFSIFCDPLTAGGNVTFTVFSAQPRTWFFLCWSLSGSGPTGVGSNGLVLNLSPPIQVTSPFGVNGQGSLTIGPVPLPPNMVSGTNVWVQGVNYAPLGPITEQASNLLSLTVN
ncbi:MAG: hypothetical protein QGH77_06500, partial [Planctomycetota bacterium]|nr:hypothetical protein [Planctomycetota bacterium]